MMLEFANVSFYYHAFPAVSHLSFSIDAGEFVGLLGLARSGKTTVLRLASGFCLPIQGAVTVNGCDPVLSETRENIGYMPFGPPLPESMRSGEYLCFRAALKGMDRRRAQKAAREMAEQFGLTECFDQRVAALSQEDKQCLGLAEALLGLPHLLLLDEPTNHLGPERTELVMNVLDSLKERTTLVFASRSLPEVERLCGRVLVVDGGVLVRDSSPQKLAEEAVEERTLSLEVVSDEPVRETLRVIPGVKTVQVRQRAHCPGTVSVYLTMPAGVDLRCEIAGLCARRGWIVSEMRLQAVTLEDIFRTLSRNS